MDKRLLWLALGGFAGGNEGFLIGGLLPWISEDLGVTLGQAGFAAFGYALAYAVGTPVLTSLLGGQDRRLVLVGAELTFVVGALLIAMAPTFPMLVAARMFLALGAGLFTATAYATATAISPPERRGRAIAFVTAGQSLALVAGVPLATLVTGTIGWRAVYLLIALVGLAAASGLWFRLPTGMPGDRQTFWGRFSVLKVPGVPTALLTTLLSAIGWFLRLIYIAPIAAFAAGYGTEALPLILFANGIGSFIGASAGGQLADRLGARRSVVLTCLAQAVLFLAIAATPLLPEGLSQPAFLICITATGFLNWAFWAPQSSLLTGLAQGSVPLALSLNLTALNVGIALCAVMGGAILDGFGAYWVVLAGVPFLLGAATLAIGNRHTAQK